MRTNRLLLVRALLVGLLAVTRPAFAASAAELSKPNILVIFGDDIGWFNVSSYSGDLMGVPTPNIDRIGKEGLRLSAFYAQPSCTAGRAAFITGQLPVRTGLTTVGTPGSPAGLQKEDITLAEVLKTKGYAHDVQKLPMVNGPDFHWQAHSSFPLAPRIRLSDKTSRGLSRATKPSRRDGSESCG